ncbi:putative ribonuclease H-like domain-containing protein [Tanacetum coccineum]|uniref:Ribonuclease H-like domain-containing protein n=1 Tax=Tanacetum coccineum TaxID=301880 RepID=A0ABQ5FG23_9ASTR
MEPSTVISPIPTTRVHSIHPKAQINGDPNWVEAMQEELLQFKIQKIWTLVDLPSGKKAIGTKVEAIRIFLAFASFMNFLVYQMDVKSAFLYGTIEKEVYVCQPPGFVDLEFPEKVYKVEKALYGLHQAPRAYIRTTSTPMETNMALTKDEDGEDVDVHLYRFQVLPKVSHLNVVKRIFRYLKGQPKLGLWYPKDSPLTLEAFSNSDYAGASLDRKSTTGGCQFLGSRLISWQCKKQTTTKIHVDNESAICVVKNPIYHSKTKHIVIRHHFIRDSYEKRLIDMVKIHTDNNVANLLTKALIQKRSGPQSGYPPIKVGDEAVHKELGNRMERAATTASSFEAEQDSDAQTRFETQSKSPMTHLSQELTHLEVGRTLEDNGGVTTLPNLEIFEKLALMGAPETSPSRITSSPSLSPQHTPVSTPSTSQPPNTQPTPDAEEVVPMPHELPLHSVHSLGRDEGSLSLSELMVLQGEEVIANSQSIKLEGGRRGGFRIVVSDEKECLEDPSKQGCEKLQRLIKDLYLHRYMDEGTSWIQEDIEIQEKISDDTEVVLEEEEPTKLVEDQGSGEKGEKQVSTVGAEHSTVIPKVSTAAENIMYIRRSAEKKKDKGKGIMIKPEKKTKKQLEQERLMSPFYKT